MPTEVLDIHDLTEDPQNARIHPESNRSAIRASLGRFGPARSIVLDADNVVRAGNGTIEAARLEGFREVLVVDPEPGQLVAVRRSDWSDSQASAYALADNRTAESAQWNDQRVAETLAAISDTDERRATGFSDADVAALLESLAQSAAGPLGSDTSDSSGLPANTGNAAEPAPSLGSIPEPAAPDRHAELVAKWRTESGQVWLILSPKKPDAPHRLVIGDCSDPSVVRLACPDRVQGIVTSPPYAEQRKGQYRGVPADDYVDWWRDIQANMRSVLRPDGSLFVNIKPHCEGGQRHLYCDDLKAAMVRQWDWAYVDEFVWIRTGPPGSWPNRLKNGFEPIHHFSINNQIKFNPLNVATIGEGSLIGVSGDRDYRATGSGFACKPESAKQLGPVLPSNVIYVNVGEHVKGHSATFPVGLPEFFVKAFSDPGDTWLDPFVGSGTTILACERNDRIGVGIEELPTHAAVILQRLEDSGLTPVLA
ncbi:DNA modification methylase [Singulisphaera sp. Ch08]|uniref:Methyltransferase n=1 Tax=Singulisphaera sp. Ch08 TaxID=3120278 RepID=A0AAU7CKY0_9BACT